MVGECGRWWEMQMVDLDLVMMQPQPVLRQRYPRLAHEARPRS